MVAKYSLSLYEMTPTIYDSYIDTKMERRNFDEVFRRVKKYSNNRNKTRILDLCCGTGIFPRKWLSKMAGVEYHGIDTNLHFLSFARKNLPKPNYRFTFGNVISKKVKGRFDIILATSSYHHIQDSQKRKYLRNAIRHMKKNGVLINYEKMVPAFRNKQ